MFNPIEVFANTAFIISSIALSIFIIWVGGSAIVNFILCFGKSHEPTWLESRRATLPSQDVEESVVLRHLIFGHSTFTKDEDGFDVCTICGVTEIRGKAK